MTVQDIPGGKEAGNLTTLDIGIHMFQRNLPETEI